MPNTPSPRSKADSERSSARSGSPSGFSTDSERPVAELLHEAGQRFKRVAVSSDDEEPSTPRTGLQNSCVVEDASPGASPGAPLPPLPVSLPSTRRSDSSSASMQQGSSRGGCFGSQRSELGSDAPGAPVCHMPEIPTGPQRRTGKLEGFPGGLRNSVGPKTPCLSRPKPGHPAHILRAVWAAENGPGRPGATSPDGRRSTQSPFFGGPVHLLTIVPPPPLGEVVKDGRASPGTSSAPKMRYVAPSELSAATPPIHARSPVRGGAGAAEKPPQRPILPALLPKSPSYRRPPFVQVRACGPLPGVQRPNPNAPSRVAPPARTGTAIPPMRPRPCALAPGSALPAPPAPTPALPPRVAALVAQSAHARGAGASAWMPGRARHDKPFGARMPALLARPTPTASALRSPLSRSIRGPA